jgi:hypothetical protein
VEGVDGRNEGFEDAESQETLSRPMALALYFLFYHHLPPDTVNGPVVRHCSALNITYVILMMLF